MVCGSWMNTKHIACDHVKTHWLDVNIIWWLNFFYHLLKLSTYENKNTGILYECFLHHHQLLVCLLLQPVPAPSRSTVTAPRRQTMSMWAVKRWSLRRCWLLLRYADWPWKTRYVDITKNSKFFFKLALNVLLTYRQSAFFPPEFVNCFQMNNVQIFC